MCSFSVHQPTNHTFTCGSKFLLLHRILCDDDDVVVDIVSRRYIDQPKKISKKRKTKSNSQAIKSSISCSTFVISSFLLFYYYFYCQWFLSWLVPMWFTKCFLFILFYLATLKWNYFKCISEFLSFRRRQTLTYSSIDKTSNAWANLSRIVCVLKFLKVNVYLQLYTLIVTLPIA